MYSLYKWNPSVTLVTEYLLFGNKTRGGILLKNCVTLKKKKCKRICLKRETLRKWCVL